MSKEESKKEEALFREELAKRLRTARMKRGWTIYDVQRYIGVPSSTIAMYERAEVDMPARTAALLARLYNVSADWLLTGRDTAENVRRRWPEFFEIYARLERYLNPFEKDKFMALFSYLARRPAMVDELLNTIDAVERDSAIEGAEEGRGVEEEDE